MGERDIAVYLICDSKNAQQLLLEQTLDRSKSCAKDLPSLAQ
jgi:hypothetical protein